MALPELGKLGDPALFHDPLDVSGSDEETLFRQLRMMLVIRKAEEKLGDMVAKGEVHCPAHLGIGQEAIAVGVSAHLRSTDRVLGAHRSHSHYLALGGDVYELFAETLGKLTGCSRGMGGSMHLFDGARGFVGSVPIVAATIPIAVGAALAAQRDGLGDVAVSYFGDGAVEEGVFHESLNLASQLKLPVIFVCENNLFASHMHISLRQPSNSTARFALAHGIETDTIEGNDIVAVSEASAKAVERARSDAGPSFLEMITYRWRGHVGPREDQDVGVKRSQDLVSWKQRDPIARLANGMINAGMLTSKQFSDLKFEVETEIEDAWSRAMEAPYPDEAALLDWVYFSNEGAGR